MRAQTREQCPRRRRRGAEPKAGSPRIKCTTTNGLGIPKCDAKNPHGLDVSVPRLGFALGVPALGGPRNCDRVFGVGLAPSAPTLTVRPVDLDDGNALAVEVAGEPRTVAAGSLNTHELDGAELREPAMEGPIARRRRLEALHAKERSPVVQGGSDVLVEVRAIVVIVIPSLVQWVGVAPHQRDDGQDSDGPVRQAPMRSLRPTNGCRVRARARPTDRLEDSPRGRQPGFVESELARARTQTLAALPFQVVDRQLRLNPRCREWVTVRQARPPDEVWLNPAEAADTGRSVRGRIVWGHRNWSL